MPPKKNANKSRVPASTAARKSAPISREAPQVPPGADTDDSLEDFDQLMEEIVKDPEAISRLTDAQVLELQRRWNPYGRIGGQAADEERQRAVAVSYTNLREDYLRRVAMTSLVGFVFQMLHEWDVPAEQRRWTPPDAPTAAAAWTAAELVERLKATLAIAEEAQAAAAEAASMASATRASEFEATAHARAESAAARAAGLLYAATHASHVLGREATARLRPAADAGMAFPEVAALLAKYPMPAAAGAVELPADRAKAIIDGFLRNYFEFDPSVHVRSGHSGDKLRAAVAEVLIGETRVPVDTLDPRRLTLDAIRAAAPKPAPAHVEPVQLIMSSAGNRNAVLALLADEELAAAAAIAVADPVTFRHYLTPVAADSPARPAADVVPPQDTFHRWGYYTEVNYEELRAITECLYPERSDLDWAIGIWEFFEGSPAEVKAAFDKHCQKYQDDVPSAIKLLELGAWSLLADFKENRKNIEFYNRNTEVMKRILDRHAEDKRIGAPLMRNRVRAAKARNIAEDGPDAAGLKAYRAAVAERGQGLGAQGAERVISPEEMLRLEKARGNRKAAQELELLEQTEKTIAELGAAEKCRELTADEREDLRRARESIDAIREMVNVPENAIQVDVFTNDTKAGTFTKSNFYTAAEAPEHLQNDTAAAAAMAGASQHPAVARQLAPYAAAHHAESTRPRTAAEMHAEALSDAK